MLTTKKAVLIINGYKPESARRFFNFEGIEIIHEPREIKQSWSYNKTPIMHMGDMDEDTRKNYCCIDVPYHMTAPEDFIEFCHQQGIECGEFVYNRKIDTSKEHCFLCHISNHGGKRDATEFNRTTERIPETIMYESGNFYVKIELGCMIKGMLMICPKRHYLSAAQLPEKMFKEYYEVMYHVEWLLKAIYGDKPVIFFEHGSAPSGLSSHKRSIVHAHTHVAWGVPFDKKYLEAVCVRPVKCESVSKDSKYFSYQEGAGGQLYLVNNPRVYIQRQYPRQVIGEMLGIPNELTNWRKEQFMENVIQTFEDFYKFLTENADTIPEIIKTRTMCFVEGYQQGTDWRLAKY